MATVDREDINSLSDQKLAAAFTEASIMASTTAESPDQKARREAMLGELCKRKEETQKFWKGEHVLVVKPCQAQKTAEVLDVIKKDLEDQRNVLHVFISDNYIDQAQQTLQRLESIGVSSVCVWHSEGKLCEKFVKTGKLGRTEGEKINFKSINKWINNGLRHIITLANNRRLGGDDKQQRVEDNLNVLLQTLLDDKGLTEKDLHIKLYLDEADETIATFLNNVGSTISRYKGMNRIKLYLITATPLVMFNHIDGLASRPEKPAEVGKLKVHKCAYSLDKYTGQANHDWVYVPRNFEDEQKKVQTASQELSDMLRQRKAKEKLPSNKKSKEELNKVIDKAIQAAAEHGSDTLLELFQSMKEAVKEQGAALDDLAQRMVADLCSQPVQQCEMLCAELQAALTQYKDTEATPLKSPPLSTSIQNLLIEVSGMMSWLEEHVKSQKETDEIKYADMGPGSYVYVPALWTTDSHYALASYLAGHKGVAVLVINGDGYTFYAKGSKTGLTKSKKDMQTVVNQAKQKDLAPNATMTSSQAGDESATVQTRRVELINNFSDPVVDAIKWWKDEHVTDCPLFVTGLYCVGRAITMQSQKLQFTHALFPQQPPPSERNRQQHISNMYQMAARIAGTNIEKKYTAVLTTCRETKKWSDIFEKVAVTIVKDYQGQLMDCELYSELMRKATEEVAAGNGVMHVQSALAGPSSVAATLTQLRHEGQPSSRQAVRCEHGSEPERQAKQAGRGASGSLQADLVAGGADTSPVEGTSMPNRHESSPSPAQAAHDGHSNRQQTKLSRSLHGNGVARTMADRLVPATPELVPSGAVSSSDEVVILYETNANRRVRRTPKPRVAAAASPSTQAGHANETAGHCSNAKSQRRKRQATEDAHPDRQQTSGENTKRPKQS